MQTNLFIITLYQFQNISILGPIIVSPGTGTMLDLQLGAVKNMETSDL